MTTRRTCCNDSATSTAYSAAPGSVSEAGTRGICPAMKRRVPAYFHDQRQSLQACARTYCDPLRIWSDVSRCPIAYALYMQRLSRRLVANSGNCLEFHSPTIVVHDDSHASSGRWRGSKVRGVDLVDSRKVNHRIRRKIDCNMR